MTDEDILALLKRGRETAKELQPVTDSLTETLGQIERALFELNWGVEASVRTAYGWTLRFSKEGRFWRLLSVRDDGATQLIVNSSRVVRVTSTEYLGDLLAAMANETEETLKPVRDARKIAEQFLNLLKRNR